MTALLRSGNQRDEPDLLIGAWYSSLYCNGQRRRKVAQVDRCAGQWEDLGEIRKRVSWAALLNRFWRFNCRARAIDHLLYERNSGFWR